MGSTTVESASAVKAPSTLIATAAVAASAAAIAFAAAETGSAVISASSVSAVVAFMSIALMPVTASIALSSVAPSAAISAAIVAVMIPTASDITAVPKPARMSPVIPRPCTDKESVYKPVRPVVPIRGARVRIVVIVAVRTHRRSCDIARPDSDADTDLRLGI
jgi:hypothetical protein